MMCLYASDPVVEEYWIVTDTLSELNYNRKSIQLKKANPESEASTELSLCENDIDANIIQSIKLAMVEKGAELEDIEGDTNEVFMDELREFQNSNGLPVGGFNLATLRFLSK